MNAIKTIAQPGALNQVRELVADRPAVLVTSPGWLQRGATEKFSKVLGKELLGIYGQVKKTPSIDACLQAAAFMQQFTQKDKILIGLGGGSVLDTTKVMAAACDQRFNEKTFRAWLKDANNIPEDLQPNDTILIPTTAGSGSEVTMWASVWDRKKQKKSSLTHPKLYAQHVILDAALTCSLPIKQTLASALDALSHACESVWNKHANPQSDMEASRALLLLRDGLEEIQSKPQDLRRREQLLKGANHAGLAFAQTKTAIAHSLSYPLTSVLSIEHGVATGFSLAEIFRMVATHNPERAEIISKALGEKNHDSCYKSLLNLLRKSGIKQELSSFIRSANNLEQIKSKLITPARADNFILPCNEEEAFTIMNNALFALGIRF